MRIVAETSTSVVVVGGGIAGLAAAVHLLPSFPDLLLLEASGRLGGRIAQVHGVLPWPVELGPEFVHGKNSSLQGLLAEMGCRLSEQNWPNMWYFKSERRLKPASEPDADIEAVTDRFESVGQQELPARDLSAEQWLRDGGASERMIDIADACFANDFGCSIEQLGMREMILENRKWDSGDTYLLLDRSLSALTEHLSRRLAGRVLLDWPVTVVERAGGGLVLHGSGGRRLHCQRVVLTLPLAVLQRGDVLFRPPLPTAKLEALARVKMSNAIKVIIALEKPIWPPEFFDVVCPGCLIPEFWVTTYPAKEGYQGSQLFGITGFVCGRKADELSAMRPSALLRATLDQLDDIFGSGAVGSPTRRPATSAFVRAHLVDWSKEPFIRGAYSYPSLGAEIGDRDTLAQSVDSLIYFAGEATHPAINPCLQAAYDTGVRAAEEILQVSKGADSKL